MPINDDIDYTVETDNGKTIIHYPTIKEVVEAADKLKKPYKIFIKYEVPLNSLRAWNK